MRGDLRSSTWCPPSEYEPFNVVFGPPRDPVFRGNQDCSLKKGEAKDRPSLNNLRFTNFQNSNLIQPNPTRNHKTGCFRHEARRALVAAW
jgi:hypothetical protein